MTLLSVKASESPGRTNILEIKEDIVEGLPGVGILRYVLLKYVSTKYVKYRYTKY